MSRYDLTGRKVLITGGSSGIGYVIAQTFAEAGADVTILAHVDEVHDAAKKLSAETGRSVAAIKGDVRDRPWLADKIGALDRIEVLINNAGGGEPTPIDDPAPDAAEKFDAILAVNVTGVYNVTREALKKMTEGGRIIITSSIWGKTAEPEWSAYVAAKHAVIGFMRCLAKELGPRGISVNCVCPGSTATETNLRVLPPDTLALVKSQMWLRPDLIPPSHIANAFLFLASDAGSEITGQALNVDRGQFAA